MEEWRKEIREAKDNTEKIIERANWQYVMMKRKSFKERRRREERE